MFFRSPLPSLGLLKTVTLVLAILLPMSWPRTLPNNLEISTKALAGSGTAYDYANLLADLSDIASLGRKSAPMMRWRSRSRGLWCGRGEARRFRQCLLQSAGKTKMIATPQTRGSARVSI
jgi:hypothetical protein